MRAFCTCANNIFFPLLLFPAPHHHPAPPPTPWSARVPWPRDRAPSQVAMAVAMGDHCHGCLTPPPPLKIGIRKSPSLASVVVANPFRPPRPCHLQNAQKFRKWATKNAGAVRRAARAAHAVPSHGRVPVEYQQIPAPGPLHGTAVFAGLVQVKVHRPPHPPNPPPTPPWPRAAAPAGVRRSSRVTLPEGPPLRRPRGRISSPDIRIPIKDPLPCGGQCVRGRSPPAV